jgi:hypothetical protein
LPAKALAAKTEGSELRRDSPCHSTKSIKEVVMHEEEQVRSEAVGRALQERKRLSQKLEQNNKPVNHGGSGTR